LPGVQLRYFITAGEQIVALAGFGAAAWQTAPRNQFIGWDHDQRKKNLNLIVNQCQIFDFTMDPIEKSCIKNSFFNGSATPR
jgi:hypothetical protein